MASSSQSMPLAEYQTYILEIIKRLHSENTLDLVRVITPEGKTKLTVQFHAPEWFSELNKDVQVTAFENLQMFVMNKLSKVASDSGLAQHVVSECDCCNHSDKRQKY